jgi:hypothetical protein
MKTSLWLVSISDPRRTPSSTSDSQQMKPCRCTTYSLPGAISISLISLGASAPFAGRRRLGCAGLHLHPHVIGDVRPDLLPALTQRYLA